MKIIILLFLICPVLGLAQVQYGQTIYGTIVNETYGRDLSYSGDGNRLVVADGKNGSGNIIGQVKVFDFIDNTWTQVGQTLPHEAIGPLNSVAVAISENGSRIAVASMGNSPNVVQSSSIKVFEYVNNSWTQIGQEIFPLTVSEQFAFRIAFSRDGSTLAAGAYHNDNNALNSGYVRVFSYENNSWQDKGPIIEGSYNNSQFGHDLALSANGSILAIKGSGETYDQGFVRFYEYVNNDWLEVNSISTVDTFGYRIGLTPDAQNIIIGNPLNSNASTNPGQVKIYSKINNNWVQKGSDLNGLEAGDYFGLDVSISDDGNIIAIGAPRHNYEGLNMGYINLYKYENNDWVLFGEQIRGYNNSDFVGNSITLSPDGTRLAVGFLFDDTNAVNSGKMITYDLTLALSIEEVFDLNFQIYPNPAKNQFTIQLHETSILEKINIYNILGEEVLNTEELVVNTSNLSSGTYIVEVSTNKGQSSKILIIE